MTVSGRRIALSVASILLGVGLVASVLTRDRWHHPGAPCRIYDFDHVTFLRSVRDARTRAENQLAELPNPEHVEDKGRPLASTELRRRYLTSKIANLSDLAEVVQDQVTRGGT